MGYREICNPLLPLKCFQATHRQHFFIKTDGRALRATGRVEPFATRLKGGVKADIIALAKKEGCTMAEIVEKAIAAYKGKLPIDR
jgi:hypothetical protein